MSGRIRRPSASTSASTPRGGSRHKITDESPRSESGTPMFDDDEEGARKRSTRGRNPLPPSSGPLFPPLPPKLPKSRISGNSFGADLEPPLETSPAQSEKPDLPSTSNASLTPPPPGSEDVLLDDEEEEEAANDEEGMESGDKDVVQPKIEVEEATEAQVKEEELARNAESQSRAKRRRGEEALLLDDHLLPPEIRNISQQSTSRRSSNAKGDLEDERRRKKTPREDIILDDKAVERAMVERQRDPSYGKTMQTVRTAEDLRRMGMDVEEEENEVEVEGEGEGEGEEDEDGGQDITRCVCQTDDPDNTSMMISCDKCNVWQHGPCMGIWGDDDAPDEYFCELCRPDLHGPLKRWIRRCGRDIAMFVPPTYDDLRNMRPHGDKSAPSQSTIFTDPARNPSPSPPPPPKPASRSHHKKEIDPPVPAQEGRRTGRRLPFPERPASQSREPAPAAKPPSLAKRKSSAGVVDPISPNRSLSPSAHMHSAARRRITMNSRDSHFEEEVKAAMEASRREALGLSPAAEVVVEEPVEEEEEKPEPKKGKRKRDEEEPAADGAPNSKSKHPNQYTYRPKPPSSSQPAAPAVHSPARRGAGGGTPAPPSIAPPQHEHGTRRAGAIAHGAIANPTLSATSVANLNWYLPDHLTAYTDLLPTPQPNALDVRSQRTLPHISRNHHANQRYGPFSNDRDGNGKLILPEEIPMREPTGEAETHLEPPARVRYPAKRITVGEIRKRVKHMMDYCSKAQSGEEKRLERNKLLGIVVTPLPKKGKGKEKADQNEDHPNGNGDSMDLDEPSGSGSDSRDPLGDIDMNIPEPASPPPKTSLELMEELTRDLISFQETYLSNTSATPLPPPISNFESSLPVPGMVSRAVSEAEAEPEVEAEAEIQVEAEAGPASAGEGSTETDAANERQVQADGLEALVFDEVAMILDHPEPELEHEEPSIASENGKGAGEATDGQEEGGTTEIPASSFEIQPPPTEIEAVPELETSSIIVDSETHPTIDDLEGQDQVMLDETIMEPTTGLDVYREGEVDQVVISGPEEVDVVDNYPEEVDVVESHAEEGGADEAEVVENEEEEEEVEEVEEQGKEEIPQVEVSSDRPVTSAVVEAVV